MTKNWKAKRDIIVRLYIDDGFCLKNVMEIMERDHGFRAS